MEKFNFVGKNIEVPEIKNKVVDVLEKQKERAKTVHARQRTGEVQKTEKEFGMIGEVEGLINQELKDLSLPEDFSLNSEDVHFVEKNSLLKGIQFEKTLGNIHSLTGDIQVFSYKDPVSLIKNTIAKIFNKNLHSHQKEFSTLVHESVHAQSHKKNELIYENKELAYINSGYRFGYELESDKRLSRSLPSLFEGFNEGVVQQTANDIIEKSNDKNLDIKKVSNKSYSSQVRVVNSIAEKIAQFKGVTKEDVLNKIKKNQFTGEMMNLRDVEKVYGEGSLRILASMRGSELPGMTLVYEKYFSTDSPQIRKMMGELILGQKKVQQYVSGAVQNVQLGILGGFQKPYEDSNKKTETKNLEKIKNI